MGHWNFRRQTYIQMSKSRNQMYVNIVLYGLNLTSTILVMAGCEDADTASPSTKISPCPVYPTPVTYNQISSCWNVISSIYDSGPFKTFRRSLWIITIINIWWTPSLFETPFPLKVYKMKYWFHIIDSQRFWFFQKRTQATDPLPRLYNCERTIMALSALTAINRSFSIENITRYHEISQCITKYHRILRNITRYRETRVVNSPPRWYWRQPYTSVWPSSRS